MTTEVPKPRGTRFPGFPSLPKLPDPSAPLDALLKTIQDIQDQGARAIEAADQLTKTAKEGAASLQQAAKTRLKAPPFPGKQPPL
mgnify:CR=1 FL=1